MMSWHRCLTSLRFGKDPRDIAVVGYDNSVASYTRPKLTTMDLHKEKMVEEAMDILFKRIAREDFGLRHEQSCPN